MSNVNICTLVSWLSGRPINSSESLQANVLAGSWKPRAECDVSWTCSARQQGVRFLCSCTVWETVTSLVDAFNCNNIMMHWKEALLNGVALLSSDNKEVNIELNSSQYVLFTCCCWERLDEMCSPSTAWSLRRLLIHPAWRLWNGPFLSGRPTLRLPHLSTQEPEQSVSCSSFQVRFSQSRNPCVTPGIVSVCRLHVGCCY